MKNGLIPFILVSLFVSMTVRADVENTSKYSREHPLIVAFDPSEPPLHYRTPQNVPIGFDIDFVKAIMKRIHVPVKFVLIPWDKMISQIKAGRADLTAFNYSIERSKELYIGGTYLTMKYVVVMRDTSAEVKTLSNLQGKTVLVRKESLAVGWLKSEKRQAKLIYTDDIPKSLVTLSGGKYDALIGMERVVNKVISDKNLNNLRCMDFDRLPAEYSFASKDKQLLDRIDIEVAKMKRDGSFDKIYQQWFSTKEAVVIPSVVYYIFGCLILAIIIYVVFNVFFRKKADKTQMLFKGFFQSPIVGMAVFDKNGIMIDLNETACKIFHMNNREAVIDAHLSLYKMKTFEKYVHESDRLSYKGIISMDLNALDYLPFYEHQSENNFHFFDTVINPVYYGDIFKGYVVMVNDVSATHRLHKELADTLRKIEFALKAANLMHWEVNLTNNSLLCFNEIILVKRDYTLNDLFAYNDLIHPDDLPSYLNLVELVKRGENHNFSLELRIRYPDDSWHHCILDGFPLEIDKQGKVARYVGFRHDVTEVMKLNDEIRDYSEKLNYVVEQSGLFIWQYNIEKRLFRISRSYTFKDCIYFTLEEYLNNLDEKDRQSVISLFDRIHNGSEERFSNERKIKASVIDGKARHEIVSGFPIKDDKGHVLYYFGLVNDVTSLIETQIRLEEEKEKAQQADRLKSAFVANMSHEIRTPLNAIVGFASLLNDAETPEERGEYLNIINKNKDVLLHLISDILDLSKIESGIVEVKSADLDLTDMFSGLIPSLTKMLNPGVEIQTSFPYRSCHVYLDFYRVRQIVTNLATNAVKNTNVGYVKIGYAIENEGVCLYVEDTGIGIRPEYKEKIFDRFVKLNDFIPGTGLGLSIVKAIVEQYQGHLDVKSEYGKGSTFSVWLPCPKIYVEE